MPGLNLIFEGPDFTGKTTQSKRIERKLCEYYGKEGILIKFADKNNLYGNLIDFMMRNKEVYPLTSSALKDDEDREPPGLIDNRRLLSYYHLKNKLKTMEELGGGEFRSLPFKIFDRYTLSSRIYDGAVAYLSSDYNRYTVKRILETPPVEHDGVYEHTGIFREYMHFLLDCVFYNFDKKPFSNEYFYNELDFGYKTLEHRMFNFTHFIFKSSRIISSYAKKERLLDQYEENNILMDFINYIYDSFESNDIRKYIGHHFFDSMHIIDTDKIIKDRFQKEEGVDKEEATNAVTGFVWEKIQSLI